MEITKIILITFAFAVTSCGDDTGDVTSKNNDNNWTEEEKVIFENEGGNSLGIQDQDYDYAILIGNPSMKLVEDDGATASSNKNNAAKSDEAGSDADDGKGKEKQDAAKNSKDSDDDEAADDEAADDETADAEVQEPSESELAACSKHFGKEVTGLKVDGNSSHADINDGDLIAVKLVGNQATVNILLTGAESVEGASIEGICLILRGNAPTANVVVNGVTVGDVYLSSAGNDASANFEIKSGSSLDNFTADIKGNSGDLILTGEGDYSCDNISLSGNASKPACGVDAAPAESTEKSSSDKKQDGKAKADSEEEEEEEEEEDEDEDEDEEA